MKLRDLRYLCAVAEHKHFGRAAAACFVSQPTLSMQLKKLETAWGVQLFERNNRYVHLTTAGQALLPKAQAVVRSADELEQYAQHLQDPLAGSVVIGVIPTVCPYMLPLVNQVLQQALPNLSIVWQELQSDEAIHALQQLELDGAILALPYDIASMHAQSLYTEPFGLLRPPVDRLNQEHGNQDNSRFMDTGKASITLEALQNQSLLLLEKGHCLRDQAMSLCGHVQWQQQRYRATSLETLRELVRSGLGATLLPALARHPNDHWVAIDGLAAHREIVMLSRPDAARQPALRAVSEVISGTVTPHLSSGVSD